MKLPLTPSPTFIRIPRDPEENLKLIQWLISWTTNHKLDPASVVHNLGRAVQHLIEQDPGKANTIKAEVAEKVDSLTKWYLELSEQEIESISLEIWLIKYMKTLDSIANWLKVLWWEKSDRLIWRINTKKALNPNEFISAVLDEIERLSGNIDRLREDSAHSDEDDENEGWIWGEADSIDKATEYNAIDLESDYNALYSLVAPKVQTDPRILFALLKLSQKYINDRRYF